MVMLGILHIGNLCSEASHQNLSIVRTSKEIRLTDFVHFYQFGTIVRSPERSHAYDPETQNRLLEKIMRPGETVPISFLHESVPYFGLFMTPFTLLPIDAAQVCFNLVTLTFGCFGLMLLLKLRDDLKLWQKATIVAGIIGSYPSIYTLSIGQATWLLAGIVSCYIYLFIKKKDILSGIFLALTTIKFQYLIFLAIPVLVARRMKLIIAAVIAELLLLLVSAQVIGWQAILSYPQYLYNTDINLPVKAQGMMSTRAVFSMLMPQAPATYCSLAVAVGACVILALSWKLVDRSQSKESTWALMALTIVAALVFSPHTHVYDALLLAVPAVLTLGSKDRFLGQAWSLMLIIYASTSWLILIGDSLLGIGPLFTAGLFNFCLLGFGAAQFWQHARKPEHS